MAKALESANKGRMMSIPIERSLHTHPGTLKTFKTQMGKSLGPEAANNSFRTKSNLGHAFPSGALDLPEVLSPEGTRAMLEFQKDPSKGLPELNLETSMVRGPSSVQEAIDTYKKRLRIGDMQAPAGDMSLLSSPHNAAHRIIAPESGVRTVF